MRILLHIHIDAAVANIGIAVRKNLLDKGYLLDDMAAGVRLDRRRQDIEKLHVVVVAVGIVLRHLHWLQLLEACLLGYLVLTLVGIVLQMAHIGDVTHIAHLVAKVLQITEQEVEGNRRTRVPEVGIAIDGGAAHIHPDTPLVERAEILFLTAECIINLQHI